MPFRSPRPAGVFLFKINLVYIINYFMFVFPNDNWYEKIDDRFTDLPGDRSVS